MTHYDVQLIGGIVLHQGKIAEMATGEARPRGNPPVFLRSLAGSSVHVVTVGDYLAKRDSSGWARSTCSTEPPSTASTSTSQTPSSAERLMECDITYGTNNEFGFDYLRDNMAAGPTSLVRRKHYYAINRRGRLGAHRRRPYTPHHIRPRAQGRRPALPPLPGKRREGRPRTAGPRQRHPRQGKGQARLRRQGQSRRKAPSSSSAHSRACPKDTALIASSARRACARFSSDRGTLSPGQRPRDARRDRSPLLRNRREEPLGRTHRQGHRRAHGPFGRPPVLRPPRH